MESYISYLSIYEYAIDALSNHDHQSFRDSMCQLVYSLQFHGHLQEDEVNFFVNAFYLTEEESHKYILLRNFYHTLSGTYEWNTGKAIEKTKKYLQNNYHLGYVHNWLAERVFDTYIDNYMYITDNPKKYYVITKRFKEFDCLGKYCEIYDENLELKKTLLLRSAEDEGTEYLKDDKVYLHDFNTNHISVINPETLEIEFVSKRDYPEIKHIGFQDENSVYYTKDDDYKTIYCMDKKTKEVEIFATRDDSTSVEFTKDHICAFTYFSRYSLSKRKVPSVRPVYYDFNGLQITKNLPRCDHLIIKTIFTCCFLNESWSTRYLEYEEVARLSETQGHISIQFIQEMIDRLCALRIGARGRIWPLRKTLQLLESIGFTKDEDIQDVLLNLMDYVRYSLENGIHPFLIFHRVFYFKLNEIIKNNPYTKDEIKYLIQYKPEWLFREYVCWEPEKKPLLEFHSLPF